MEIANMFDIVFLIFLVLFGLKGFFNGLIREVSDFFGLILGFTIGVLYYRDVGEFMHSFIPSLPPSICYGISFTLLVMVIWSISNLIGYLVERKLSLPGLLIVKILGIFVSMLKFVVILAVIIAVFMTMISDKRVVNRYFGNSIFFKFERKIGEGLFKLKPAELERFFNLQMDRLRRLKAKIHPQKPTHSSETSTSSTSEKRNSVEVKKEESASVPGVPMATPEKSPKGAISPAPAEEVNISILPQ